MLTKAIDNLKFRYKIFLPAAIVLTVFLFFVARSYFVASKVEERLAYINRLESDISHAIEKITSKISQTQNDFVVRALQERSDDKLLDKTENSFKDIEGKIDKLKKRLLLRNKTIKDKLAVIQIRLKGFKSILFDLPVAVKESKEDALYDIISLNMVYIKIEKELNAIQNYIKKSLDSEIVGAKVEIQKNLRMTLYLFLASVLFILLFGYIVKKEIKNSISNLKRLTTSLNDFLLGKVKAIEKIEDFSKDELGEILYIVQSSIKGVERLFNKERELQNRIKELNSSLQERVDDAVNEIKELNKEIEATQREVIFKIGSISEMRSKETDLHVKRVAEYSFILARLCGLSMEDSLLLRDASPMHDIGKIAIPDAILHKNGKLTEKEFEIMKNHTTYGYDMLSGSTRPLIKAASIVAYEHHEKWDGSGYPRGLKGEEIHIFGRITAVADVFDALGSDRVYKKAWPVQKILKLFEEEKERHFDPKLIDIFLDNLPHFIAAKENIEQYGDAKNLLKLIQNYTDIIDQYGYVNKIEL